MGEGKHLPKIRGSPDDTEGPYLSGGDGKRPKGSKETKEEDE